MTIRIDTADHRQNFLVTLLAAGGAGQSLLLLASGLVAKGHRVGMIGEGVQRRQAEDAGIHFTAWPHLPERPAGMSVTDPQKGVPLTPRDELRALALFLGASASAFAKVVSQELDREGADLVIALDMLHGVQAACEARAQRFVTVSPSINPFPAAGLPPFGSGLAPARNAEEVAHQAQITREAQAVFDAGLPDFNRARNELGLSGIAHMADQVKAGPHFLCTARAFDFAYPELPAHFRYVGPLIDPQEASRPWASPWAADDPRPLALIAFSTTFQNQLALLQHVVAACASLPIRVLVTLGNALQPRDIDSAANTVIVGAAPHMAVMREAAVVITHGGHGTIMAALINRLPLLAIPQGRDQHDNAIRVTERGAGLALPPGASMQEIQSAVVRLLGEDHFRVAAKRLGDAIAAETDYLRLLTRLEGLAAARQTEDTPGDRA
ncbi:MAG TPA: nucleotide disphospho-sugar-binding domain-containing protein [Steroidobacteraceae bacterium]|nr:nucleotide disphospho-sugar-binding domain-containing protein [Steroidobacteraceae bacterium]